MDTTYKGVLYRQKYMALPGIETFLLQTIPSQVLLGLLLIYAAAWAYAIYHLLAVSEKGKRAFAVWAAIVFIVPFGYLFYYADFIVDDDVS